MSSGRLLGCSPGTLHGKACIRHVSIMDDYRSDLQDHLTHGIRAGLFWVPTPGTHEQGMPGYNYLPSDFAGWIWNHDRSVGSLGRAYNYPHQTVVYWSLYRAAKEHASILLQRPRLWYLQQACRTIQVIPASQPTFDMSSRWTVSEYPHISCALIIHIAAVHAVQCWLPILPLGRHRGISCGFMNNKGKWAALATMSPC